MSKPKQTQVRNPDGTFTVDMWGISYAAPMNDLRRHPPMALFFHVDTATKYRDQCYRERSVNNAAPCLLDVRLLRVTVGQWVEPPFAPERGQRVRGVDADGVEWEGPYGHPDASTGGHWLGSGNNGVRVVSVYRLEADRG